MAAARWLSSSQPAAVQADVPNRPQCLGQTQVRRLQRCSGTRSLAASADWHRTTTPLLASLNSEALTAACRFMERVCQDRTDEASESAASRPDDQASHPDA